MDGGIFVLIIIGIVLNMVIKGMRGRMQQPTPKQPAPRTDQGVDRPFEDQVRPQVPPLQPQPARTLSNVQPVAESRDLTQGVSPEETASEGFSMEMPRMKFEPQGAQDKIQTDHNTVAEWFRGDGIVQGIIMSEVLNPPVSRRR